MRTHYISSSGLNIPAVRDLDKRLTSQWHLGYDWTKSFDDDEELRGLDLDCAIEADLFIFLDTPHLSRGGMKGYGARLSTKKEIIHINCQDLTDSLFKLEQVTHYKSVEEFLARQHEIGYENLAWEEWAPLTGLPKKAYDDWLTLSEKDRRGVVGIYTNPEEIQTIRHVLEGGAY